MNDKAWNDPPLFSLDQMSKNSSAVPFNKRHRYPQQTATASANQQMMTTNVGLNEPLVTQQNHNFEQQNHNFQQQNHNFQQQNQNFQKINTNQYEAFDLNNFILSINTRMGSINNLPQDLIYKWHNIQSSLYSIQFENQTRINLVSLLKAIQCNDVNNARLLIGNLTFDNNELIRTTASILNAIFSYI